MKKSLIILGISLSLLLLVTPAKNDNNQYAVDNVTSVATNPNLHPILPPVG